MDDFGFSARTSNPAFSEDTFSVASVQTGLGEVMTLHGTIQRTGILLLCVVVSAVWMWNRLLMPHHPGALRPFVLISVPGGLLVGLVTIFKKSWARFTAPLYALLEGLFLGTLSLALELHFQGIAIEAVALTFGTCLCLLLAYQSGFVCVTTRFRLGVTIATGGILIVYLAKMAMGVLGIRFLYHFGSGLVSILVSLAIVAIAALNLILDFDCVERGVQHGAPKYMEWYAAFGLVVTLIWLYFEVLSLLLKARDDRP